MKISKLFHYLTTRPPDHLTTLSLYLLLTLSPLPLFSQSPHPGNWDEIIASPWYFGNLNNKPVFVYLDSINPENAYFFVADKSIPTVYDASIKWKHGDPNTIKFIIRNKKVKARFIGTLKNDTIAGYLITSKKTAIHLGVSPRLSIFMTKEQPSSPLPLFPFSPLHRFSSPCFPSADIISDVSFGAATGYYTSMTINTEGYDYQQIILDAMQKMYINPTQEAAFHLLNKDPVSFGLTDLQPLRLDIYQPTGDVAMKRPLILLLHGGAFILGDKATASNKELAIDFARKGYVVASLNYRIGFNPASKSSLERSAYRAVQDARAALRFLSANAATYRIDPNYVFLGGSSAGAITALNTAFMTEDERPESTRRNIFRAQVDLGGLDESTNDITGSFNIRAVVNLWGAVSDTNILDKNENIPVLSIHGDADRIVPYNIAYPFLDLDTTYTCNIVSKLYGSCPVNRRLQNLGIHSELITLNKAGHEPQFELGMYRLVMDTVMARATEFYFRALFNFPEVIGPRQIAIGTAPSAYSIKEDDDDDISYYWQVMGGKLIPGSAKNTARVSWLAEKEGNISLILSHRLGGSAEVRVPVEIP